MVEGADSFTIGTQGHAQRFAREGMAAVFYFYEELPRWGFTTTN